MKKNGFTLMELLLVVAILAIVAAAAAPTFSKGAADAMMEARKSNFYSSYQNAVSGANMMMAIQTAQGLVAKKTGDGDTLDYRRIDAEDKDNRLGYYSPVASRMFTDVTGKQYGWSAKVTASQTVEFVLMNAKASGDSLENGANHIKAKVEPTDNINDLLAKIWGEGDISKYVK